MGIVCHGNGIRGGKGEISGCIHDPDGRRHGDSGRFTCKAIEPNLEHAYVYYMDFVLKDKMDMQAEKELAGELFK